MNSHSTHQNFEEENTQRISGVGVLNLIINNKHKILNI